MATGKEDSRYFCSSWNCHHTYAVWYSLKKSTWVRYIGLWLPSPRFCRRTVSDL